MLNPNITQKDAQRLSTEIAYAAKNSPEKPKEKTKIGVYALTSCYGCQLSIAMVSKLLDVIETVDFKSYYMLSSASSMHDKVDIAFVEGSVSTEQDLEELQEIRKNSN